jgi:DNA polymerase III subunit epsilon
MRQIILDTETTGLEPKEGHRIIEIGCVEMVNRRITQHHFHHYLQPDRKIDDGALAVHGITNEFLKGKPRFRDLVNEFINFVKDAEVIIHNADFDCNFINHELQLLRQDWQPLSFYCKITDTLAFARKLHPGQKNSLDALCKRYNIDNSRRDLHGALLDAQLLAEVYLAMTGGQVTLLGSADGGMQATQTQVKRLAADRPRLPVLLPTEEERHAHQKYLDGLEKSSGGKCLWKTLPTENSSVN